MRHGGCFDLEHGAHEGPDFECYEAPSEVVPDALKWAADHWFHYAHCDKPKNLLSIQRGFWSAQIGWVLLESRTPTDMRLVAYPYRVPQVCLQHRFYVPLAVPPLNVGSPQWCAVARGGWPGT